MQTTGAKKGSSPGSDRPWSTLGNRELDQLLLELTDDQLARRFRVAIGEIRDLRARRLGEAAGEAEPTNPAHDV